MSSRQHQPEKHAHQPQKTQQLDPSRSDFSNIVKNTRTGTGHVIKAGDPLRPDERLSTIGEAHNIANDLIHGVPLSGDVQVHDAEPEAGMPPMQGDFRPLLLTFTEEHPVTKQPVTFHVPAGLLVTEEGKFPTGEWFLDYDDRMVRRRPI